MPAMQRRNTSMGSGSCPSVSAMDELYEPLDVFARGSFGVVRKVIRRSDGTVLCRKELNYGRMNDQDLQQLNTEVHVLQTMPQCEHIVRYHERFVDKRECMLYIVMEFCEGGDLARVIQRCRRDKVLLPEAHVWSYLTQITVALSECHAEHDANGNRKTVVLHRDIKPENVFLSKDNMVKLGDFGLSKAMAAAAFTSTYVGTPYYMSPELTNQQQYDAKSDIWALGCLIYELCAQQPPFAEAQTQEQLTKLIHEGKIPKLPAGYSQTLYQVIKSMLRQDPRSRPTTEQIKGLDQVKHQVDLLSMRKIKDALVFQRDSLQVRQTALAAREQALAEREKALNERQATLQQREQNLARNQQALADDKQRLRLGQLPAVEYDGESDNEEGDTLTRSPTEERENLPPSARSTLENAGYVKMAQRPSLVPRRPLEERRSMIGLSTLARRQSSNSLMSLDETPSRMARMNLNAAGTPGSARRIVNSRSMHNLHVGSPKRDSAHTPPVPGLASSGTSRSSVSTDASSLKSPAESFTSPEMSYAPRAISPSKRPAPSSSGGSQPGSAGRPAGPARTATAPTPPNVRYDLLDDDDVPSPFIKKKASAPPSVMRRLVGNAVGPLRAAPSRPSPVTAQMAAAAPATSAAGVKLMSKLATGRVASGLSSVDEQGRTTRSGRRVSAAVSATIS